ncbi:MAG: divergent polysaccharide deacetylase family protein [Candidatus Coatesbacteria bacterium]
MSIRGGQRRFGRWILAAALAVAAGALWLILRPPAIEDRSARGREAVSAVETWAKRRGLRPNESGSRKELRADDRVRWLDFDLGFWHPPRRNAAVLARELVQLAGPLGLRARPAPAEGGAQAVEFSFADGRPAGRVWMRRECLVAIVIDDMGFNLNAAKRVIALPCPVTCAIIPFAGHAKAVVRLARAAGKEIYIHMPMESPFRAADVPEYRCILRPGMDRARVAELVRLAMTEVPHAAGMNNHEGSLATESPELMADLMQVLKPLDLVFMDSGTTEKTVAWMAARDAGLRWQRRNVFLDAEYLKRDGAGGRIRNPAAIEAEFSRLIGLARQRGVAIAIGHAQFAATLETLARRIPEARREGVEFVPASWLAHPGKP